MTRSPREIAICRLLVNSLHGRVQILTLPLSACFSPVLTGGAKENYANLRVVSGGSCATGRVALPRACHAESDAPQRRYDANFADRLSPIAYSYAP
jgi:hypothetical protein